MIRRLRAAAVVLAAFMLLWSAFRAGQAARLSQMQAEAARLNAEARP